MQKPKGLAYKVQYRRVGGAESPPLSPPRRAWSITRKIGKSRGCGSGKTSLAAHLGKLALESGEKVAYATISDFIYTVLHKDETNKQRDRFKYFQSCSLIILDEVMYTRLTPEDLTVFYQYIMLLSETRSIVCITNRELSAWADGAFDRHLMQTLVDRITNGAQVIRLI